MTNFAFDRNVKIVAIDRKNPLDIVTIENPGTGDEPLKVSFQAEKQLSNEASTAFVEIYNLTNDTASKFNFRIPPAELVTGKFTFGKKIEIYAGYGTISKRIFSGVITSAVTSTEGVYRITRLECRTIYYELMEQVVNLSFAKGEPKTKAVLDILSAIGATLNKASTEILQQRLAGQVFKDTTNFTNTAYNVINQINKGLTNYISIYFDDIGVSFAPIGLALNQPAIVYDKNSGLIGTPVPTEIGVDFEVLLDPDLQMSAPVIIKSETVDSFFKSIRVDAQTPLVIKKVIHAGSNKAGDRFTTRASAVFDNANFFAQYAPVNNSRVV